MRLHEVLVVVVIIAGAISAVLAKSTMAAVLSLGVVGYGVAMTFLLYGAPDLAMTQFSVETLTVMIYVLVFRHFRNLGALSPPLVRVRDALHRGRERNADRRLVLSVSTTETRAQLREYFAEFGPTLGHGRNIVNVILVDFRGVRHDGRDHRARHRGDRRPRPAANGAVRSAGSGRISGGQPPTSPMFRTAVRLLMPLLLLIVAVSAAARAQRAGRRICRRAGRGGGVRAVPDRVRRRSRAPRAAGQADDVDRCWSADRAGQRHARHWSAANRS